MRYFYTSKYATALLFIYVSSGFYWSTHQGVSTFSIFKLFSAHLMARMFVKRIKWIHWIIIFLFFTSQVNKAQKKHKNVSNQGVVKEENVLKMLLKFSFFGNYFAVNFLLYVELISLNNVVHFATVLIRSICVFGDI